MRLFNMFFIFLEHRNGFLVSAFDSFLTAFANKKTTLKSWQKNVYERTFYVFHTNKNRLSPIHL